MWSLPDIKQMNARKAASQKQLKREANLGKSKKHACENCGKPSTVHLPYYDIFSDDISGVSHLCDECNDRCGDEDMFTCEVCERRMLDHITWERYQVNIGGVCMCLSCAAKAYFGAKENEIDPKLVKGVVQESNEKAFPLLFDPATGFINLCRVRHVLGVKQPLPSGIKFVSNYENCNEQGDFPWGTILLEIREQTKPCFLVLDGAYQFSSSVGLYVRE